MSRDEQIRLDVTARDRASDTLDDVADDVERLEEASPVDVEVDADTKAAGRALEDLERDVDALTDADRIIALRAKRDALDAELRDVRRDLEALERTNPTIEVDADTSEARRKLAAVGDAHPGKDVGEQFIRDVGGAFGGPSWIGTSADIAAAFESLGGTLGSTGAGKVVSALEGGLVPALGVGSVIAAAVVGLWQLFEEGASESAERVAKLYADKLKSLADAYDSSAVAEAVAEALSTKEKKAFGRLGVDLADVTDYVQGETVPALEDARRAYDTVVKSGVSWSSVSDRNARALANVLGVTVDVARETLEQANAYSEVETALTDNSSALQRLRDDLITAAGFARQGTRDVEEFGRTVRGLPEEQAARIYASVDEESIDYARRRLEEAVAPIAGLVNLPGGIAGRVVVDVNLNNGIITNPAAVGRAVWDALVAYGRLAPGMRGPWVPV